MFAVTWYSPQADRQNSASCFYFAPNRVVLRHSSLSQERTFVQLASDSHAGLGLNERALMITAWMITACRPKGWTGAKSSLALPLKR